MHPACSACACVAGLICLKSILMSLHSVTPATPTVLACAFCRPLSATSPSWRRRSGAFLHRNSASSSHCSGICLSQGVCCYKTLIPKPLTGRDLLRVHHGGGAAARAGAQGLAHHVQAQPAGAPAKALTCIATFTGCTPHSLQAGGSALDLSKHLAWYALTGSIAARPCCRQ